MRVLVYIPLLLLFAIIYCKSDADVNVVDLAAGMNENTNSFCDDTKCRTWEYRPDSVAYTCWVSFGSSEETDLMCAEGFEGRIVSDDISREDYEGTTQRRYTCCPKLYTGVDVVQTCSEDFCATPDGKGGKQCWAYNESLGLDPMICDDDSGVYKYARKTGGNTSNAFGMFQFQYICCNTALINNDAVDSDYVQKCTFGHACKSMNNETYCHSTSYLGMACLDNKYTIPRRVLPYEVKVTGLEENMKSFVYACCVPNQPSIDDVMKKSVCDESKCRAPSLWHSTPLWNGTQFIPQLHKDYSDKWGEAYSCWTSFNGTGIVTDSDMPCANDCEGKLIPGSLTKEHSGMTYQWYTCCPSEYPSEYNEDSLRIQQECSDAACWLTDDITIGANCWNDFFGYKPMTCADDHFKYPRRTGGLFKDQFHVEYEQYICCSTTDEPVYEKLDSECDFLACRGEFGPSAKCFTLDFLDFSSCESNTYKFPRMVGNIGGTMLSTCCKTRDSNIDKSTLWKFRSVLAMSLVSFAMCCVLIISILSDANTRNKGYNLYLLFLALPDAIFNLIQVCCLSLTLLGISVNIYPKVALYFTVVVNTWLNAVICYQILFFLLQTKICQRIAPPSPKYVCLQALATYCLGFIIMFLEIRFNIALFDLLVCCVVVIPPLFYWFYVCIRIRVGKLLPKSGRSRSLSIYMIRVGVAFVCVWLPAFMLMVGWLIGYCLVKDKKNETEVTPYMVPNTIPLYIVTLLTCFQGTLSVLVALGKPDIQSGVKKTFGSISSIFTRFAIKTTGWDEEDPNPMLLSTGFVARASVKRFKKREEE